MIQNKFPSTVQSAVVLVIVFASIFSSFFSVSATTVLPECPRGYFIVEGMVECHKLLTCSDCRSIEYVKLVGFGAVKWVFLAKWNNIYVSVSVLREASFIQDFLDGLSVLKSIPPSRYLNQLVGYCNEANLIVSEYQEFNNANNLVFLLTHNDNSAIPFQLCVNYIEILNFIHNSPIGVRVNCDSDSVEKILSQILVTRNLTLVLNDVDALPEMTPNSTITCGMNNRNHSKLLLPPELTPIRDSHQTGYTDKSDIWKVPDVCNFIYRCSNMDHLQYLFYDIHKKCKHKDPQRRLTSVELLRLYKARINDLH